MVIQKHVQILNKLWISVNHKPFHKTFFAFKISGKQIEHLFDLFISTVYVITNSSLRSLIIYSQNIIWNKNTTKLDLIIILYSFKVEQRLPL